MAQKIRIKLKAYDHVILDRSAEQLVDTAKKNGAMISGPVPLPTKRRVYTVLRSPHINKKSREQFEMCIHKRLIDIYDPEGNIMDAMMNVELPAGVNIEIIV